MDGGSKHYIEGSKHNHLQEKEMQKLKMVI